MDGEAEPDITNFLQSSMDVGADPIKLEKCTVDESLYPTDIDPQEKEYYKRKYPELNDIKTERLHCTVCDKHLGTSTYNENRIQTHTILQVLLCKPCNDFYNNGGEFDKGEDGSELYCRWCAQGGEVYCCSKCPYVFCKVCILRNLPEETIKEIESIDDWLCFKCFPKPLFELRAKCWAIKAYVQEQRVLCQNKDLAPDKRQDAFTDHSTCCKSRAAAKAKQKQLIDTEYCPSDEDIEDTEYKPSKSRKSKPSRKRSSTSRSKNSSPKRLCLPGGESEMSILPHSIFPEGNSEAYMPANDDQQDEVVCTPDIFSCLMENEEAGSGSTPTATTSEENSQPCKSPPPLVQFAPSGVNGNQQVPPPNMPRISVRPAESMQAPRILNNQLPMHPRIPLMVHPQVAVRSQLQFRPTQPNMLQGMRTINVNANNLYQLTDGRIVQVTRVPNSTPAAAPVTGVPLQTTTGKSNYVKPKPTTSAPKVTPVNQRPAVVTAGPSNTTATKTVSAGNKGLAGNSKNLGAKTLVANNNVNRIRMRKVPDWFNQRIQQCISIARTFINQLMDFRCNLLTMNDISYDEVKNLHVQLSFLMSTVIGKYKNSQNDLNTRLSEWTEALCNSLQEAIKPGTSGTTAAAAGPKLGTSGTAPVPPVVVSTGRSDQPAGGILKAALGYKETKELDAKILAKFTDRKLKMLPQVKLAKFKYDPNSKVVFRVKQISKRVVGGKGGPGSRVPLVKIIDHTKKKPIFTNPNEINEILDSDDDDVLLVPNEDPLLITIDSDDEEKNTESTSTKESENSAVKTSETSGDAAKPNGTSSDDANSNQKPSDDANESPVNDNKTNETSAESAVAEKEESASVSTNDTENVASEEKKDEAISEGGDTEKKDESEILIEKENVETISDSNNKTEESTDENSRDEKDIPAEETDMDKKIEESEAVEESLDQDQNSRESENISEKLSKEGVDEASPSASEKEQNGEDAEESNGAMEESNEIEEKPSEDTESNENGDNVSIEDMEIEHSILNEDNTNDTEEPFKNSNGTDNLEESDPMDTSANSEDVNMTEDNNFAEKIKIVDPKIFTKDLEESIGDPKDDAVPEDIIDNQDASSSSDSLVNEVYENSENSLMINTA